MSNLPAHLQRYQTRDIGSTLSANLGSAMPPHVSIAGGRFTLVDASNNELPGAWFDQRIGVYIDACIVDVNEHLSRMYFAGAYDSNAEGVRPDCFSDNGIGPSSTAGSPQAPSCTPDPTGQWGCKWAVWGSKINQNGKKVPACSQKQKVALLIPGYNILFLLAIPPNSHGPLREYTEHCKGHSINMADVLTRIYFKAGEVGTLCFQGLAYIDEPTAELRQAAWNEKKTDSLVGRTDVPRPTRSIESQVQYKGNDPELRAAITQMQPSQQPLINQNAGMGDLNLLHTQVQPNQVFQQGQLPIQQVQQPSPFVQTAQPAVQTDTGAAFATQSAFSSNQQVQPSGPFASAGTAAPSGPSTTNVAQSAGTTSPSEQPQQGRRRRRTAAEMAAANGGAALSGPNPTTLAQAPQAPFPHPGQQDTAPAQGNFGIAQPSEPSNEVKTILDDFFGGQ